MIIRPEAEADLQEAIDWYEQRRPGLGREFQACIEAALAYLGREPESANRIHGEVRRLLVRRFPYSVFYLIQQEQIIIIAFFHHRRDPSVIVGRAP